MASHSCQEPEQRIKKIKRAHSSDLWQIYKLLLLSPLQNTGLSFFAKNNFSCLKHLLEKRSADFFIYFSFFKEQNHFCFSRKRASNLQRLLKTEP